MSIESGFDANNENTGNETREKPKVVMMGEDMVPEPHSGKDEEDTYEELGEMSEMRFLQGLANGSVVARVCPTFTSTTSKKSSANVCNNSGNTKFESNTASSATKRRNSGNCSKCIGNTSIDHQHQINNNNNNNDNNSNDSGDNCNNIRYMSNNSNLTPEAVSLLTRCLQTDPSLRPEAFDLIDHPFF
uniref:Uncharacterized protein n=1 Tax=Lygus hesperus TaxID=30085 RepID=A0A0A9YBE6_LYGHE